MAIGLSVVAAIGLERESESIPIARRRLERELNGVEDLSLSICSDREDFEEDARRRVDFTWAICCKSVQSAKDRHG